MANNNYPDTTLQPLQTLDFVLADGKRVRTMLKPLPDPSRTKVAEVDIDITNAGCTLLQQLGRDAQPRDIRKAGEKAYEYAKHEASKVGGKIVEARLEGCEFLEPADVDTIVAGAFPVTLM